MVQNDEGKKATKIVVKGVDNTKYDATIGKIDKSVDLARLDSSNFDTSPSISNTIPEIGSQVIFSGKPIGVSKLSVFPGLVSQLGEKLIPSPRIYMIQIAGMINNGNSGGPVLNGETGDVIGVVTAKYVPMLIEIDKLAKSLDKIPQFPSGVSIDSIDFSKFVNVTIKSLWQLGAVLRLVQVGTGWVVPAINFNKIGVN